MHNPLWVIAINLAGIKVLPSIVNFVIIPSAASAGNAYVYSSSRDFYTLAQNGQVPKPFLRCTHKGVLVYAVLVTTSFSLLTFMSMSSTL
jgi:amino acid transporter